MGLKPLEALISSINTVTGWILGGLWRPTKATLSCLLFALLKQSQGEAGWSLPGHSLLCKHDSAAAVWGNHPVAAHSHPGQQTRVWTAGDQFKEVRGLMLALCWLAESPTCVIRRSHSSHGILMINDLRWASWLVSCKSCRVESPGSLLPPTIRPLSDCSAHRTDYAHILN